jgi:hypothetical protein
VIREAGTLVTGKVLPGNAVNGEVMTCTIIEK